MLLTKRAPVSDVFTYKKSVFNKNHVITKSSKDKKISSNQQNNKSNLIKALLCVSLLNSNNCSIPTE